MISRLIIEGFQIHKHLEIRLDKHITVLTGDNGAGKSAVARALKWLLLNQWDGKADQMINWEMDFAKVTAFFGRQKITRYKGKEGNFYQINDDKPFEAVGAGRVPQQIEALINCTEDNFQDQLDPAFWFHLTAGQVAKSLNKIVNLESIDRSLENVAKSVREAREAVKATEQRITESLNLTESLFWTTDSDADLSELERLDQDMAQAIAEAVALKSYLAQAREIARIKQNAKDVILCGQEAISAYEEVSLINRNIHKVQAALSTVKTQEAHKCSLDQKLQQMKSKLSKLKASLCPVCKRPMPK